MHVSLVRDHAVTTLHIVLTFRTNPSLITKVRMLDERQTVRKINQSNIHFSIEMFINIVDPVDLLHINLSMTFEYD